MKCIVKHAIGELDPDSLIGFATITEHVVLDVLGDATKEKFGAPYDLLSESLGTINVKYSIIHRDRKRFMWNFAKNQNAKIPDYYICLGFDEHQTEIIRVWKIPGNSIVVKKRGVVIRTIREERFKDYSIDPGIYDKTFQDMDITDLPEFCNTTKPKVSEYRYECKRWDEIYREQDLKMS